MISLVVGSILYTWILNPISGPVAIVAGWFGLKLPFWSKTEGWVIAVLCIITTWKTFGYNFINILAGVSGVSMEVIEAARLENVPMWKIFKDIVDEFCNWNLCVYYDDRAGTPVCVHADQGRHTRRTELCQFEPDLYVVP